MWRAYGVGKGKIIPYQDIIVKPQGPADLVVDLDFREFKQIATAGSDTATGSKFPPN